MADLRERPAAGAAPCDHAGLGTEPEAESVPAAARRAGVSRSFLYERIASGELPTVKCGKRRLVRVATLRRWLASLETGAA